MLKPSFKGASRKVFRVLQRRLKGVLRERSGCFKVVSKKFQIGTKGFQGSFKAVSKKFQWGFKKVSRACWVWI